MVTPWVGWGTNGTRTRALSKALLRRKMIPQPQGRPGTLLVLVLVGEALHFCLREHLAGTRQVVFAYQ